MAEMLKSAKTVGLEEVEEAAAEAEAKADSRVINLICGTSAGEEKGGKGDKLVQNEKQKRSKVALKNYCN